jgi:hypothetical protein
MGSTGLPPPRSYGYGPYGILAACCINQWPAVRWELGQEGWLKQPVAKVVTKIASKEDLFWPLIWDQVGVTNAAPISKIVRGEIFFLYW